MKIAWKDIVLTIVGIIVACAMFVFIGYAAYYDLISTSKFNNYVGITYVYENDTTEYKYMFKDSIMMSGCVIDCNVEYSTNVDYSHAVELYRIIETKDRFRAGKGTSCNKFEAFCVPDRKVKVVHLSWVKGEKEVPK